MGIWTYGLNLPEEYTQHKDNPEMKDQIKSEVLSCPDVWAACTRFMLA